MTLEPVFAAGFAVLLGVDALGWRMMVCGSLMLEQLRSRTESDGLPPSRIEEM